MAINAHVSHDVWYMWHKAALYYTQCVLSVVVDAARVCTLVLSLLLLLQNHLPHYSSYLKTVLLYMRLIDVLIHIDHGL